MKKPARPRTPRPKRARKILRFHASVGPIFMGQRTVHIQVREPERFVPFLNARVRMTLEKL